MRKTAGVQTDFSPGVSTISGAQKAFRSSGKNDFGFGRLDSHKVSSEGTWGGIQFGPPRGFILAGVNSAAGTGKDAGRLFGVHVDAENIGIVQHALMYRFPGGTTVAGSPGEMSSSGVEGAGFGGVESEGDDGLELQVGFRGHSRP